MRWGTKRAAFAVAATLVLAAGCSSSGGDDDGRLAVVASFFPLAEAAARVGGEHVAVTNLTPAGAEPHDLELTTRDLDRIEDAALVFYMSGGFQPAIETAATRAGGPAIDLRPAGVTDPHVWLDPTRMVTIVEAVRDALVASDPAHAPAYEANATAYRAELARLDTAFAEGLGNCRTRTFVTAHDAFGHLARRYHLRQESIAGLSPEAEPDPRQLADLADLVRAEGITTVFSETLVSPRVAETLARETGAQVAVLDPLEGLTADQAARGETYGSVMEANLAALRAALECA